MNWLKQLAWMVLSLSAGGLYAAERPDVVEALRAYDAGRYEEAITRYDALLQQHPQGALAFNLGNAYFKAGQKGKAAAAYLCARELRPRDPEIAANLAFVSREFKDRLDARRPETGLAKVFSFFEVFAARELGYAAGLLFIATLVLMLVRRSGARLLGVLTLLLSLFTAGGFYHRARALGHWGAVSVEEAAVYANPSVDTGPVLFKLHEGAPLWINESENGWAKIELSDGKAGWIEQANFTNLSCGK